MFKAQFRIAFLAALVIAAPMQTFAAGFCFCDPHDSSFASDHVAGHAAHAGDMTMPGEPMQHASGNHDSMTLPLMDGMAADLDTDSNECSHTGAGCECKSCGAFSGLNAANGVARVFAVQAALDIVDLYVAPPQLPTHPPPIGS